VNAFDALPVVLLAECCETVFAGFLSAIAKHLREPYESQPLDLRGMVEQVFETDLTDPPTVRRDCNERQTAFTRSAKWRAPSGPETWPPWALQEPEAGGRLTSLIVTVASFGLTPSGFTPGHDQADRAAG
jgi:hypothetical protein